MTFQIFRAVLPLAERLAVRLTQNSCAELFGMREVRVYVSHPHHDGCDKLIRMRDRLAGENHGSQAHGQLAMVDRAIGFRWRA